jgi:hypothetical protein
MEHEIVEPDNRGCKMNRVDAGHFAPHCHRDEEPGAEQARERLITGPLDSWP